MRLLHTESLDVVQFSDADIPRYAILSHTWEEEEVTLQDMQGVHPTSKRGYDKVKRCCAFARANGFEYMWIDTCCIDKTNSVELSEAINSMYRWYQEAAVCYGFLADVPSRATFSGSRWFTRGWTLQELIAPATVIFLDEGWKVMGSKASLGQDIEDCTGIPAGILSGEDDFEAFSIAQRLSWAAKRTTSRIEDRAYSLLGMFGIHMPLIYGERENAFIRLQEEIMKVSDDQSLFAWKDLDSRGGILATSPSAFADSGNIVRLTNPFGTSASSLTVSSRGIQFQVEILGIGPRMLGLAILQCQEGRPGQGQEAKRIAIYLRDLSLTMGEWERVGSQEFELLDLTRFKLSQYPMRSICVRKGRMTRRQKPEDGENSATQTYSDSALMGFMEPTALLEAAEEGLESVVWVVLTRGDVRADLRDGKGRTALSLAVGKGYEAVVQMLLARGDVRPEAVYADGLTILSWAASLGLDSIVKLLLKSGKVDVNSVSQDRLKSTPLCQAAENGHETVVRMLLNIEASIDMKNAMGKTPLWLAAENGHEAVVRLLLARGANISPTNWLDETPLFIAAEKGHGPVVQLLLDGGANAGAKNRSTWTPLLKAAVNGHGAVVQQLLDRGGDAEEGYESVARLLLDEGPGLEADVDGDWSKPPLHWAAENGRAAAVQLLLKRADVDVNSRRMTHLTPLSLAVKNGHEAIVKLLLSSGAEANLGDGGHYPKTPLLYAIAGGNEDIVRLLLDAGADTELRDHEQYDRGDTPLLLAAREGHTAAVQLLLDKGAYVEAADRETKTPLFVAAERGYDAIVKLLLDKGAVETKTLRFDETPLSRAAAEGHAAVMRLLLERRAGADLMDQDSGKALLRNAARNGHEAVVRLLLEKEADVEAAQKGSSVESPLVQAAHAGHEAVVRLLLDHGANPGVSGAEGHSRSPLVPAAQHGHESIVRLLLERGANPNPKIESPYMGPLQYAAKEGHAAIVRLLLEKGADTEATEQYDRTALFSATKEGHEAVVQLLLEHGANTEVTNDRNQTPLILAAYQRRPAIVQLLLNGGADVEAADRSGRTPLWWAAEQGQEQISQLLLDKGANPERVDGEGKTPLQMALRREQWTIVRLMRSRAGTAGSS